MHDTQQPVIFHGLLHKHTQIVPYTGTSGIKVTWGGLVYDIIASKKNIVFLKFQLSLLF